jgi:prepilin-type processing-associated H-X9-DG protein/prepilin-type N-terminal cleavage/methylation domain-containing protein
VCRTSFDRGREKATGPRLARVLRQRQGFTLVELLVVIGIIVLLVGILRPVIGRAREQARAVQCASNISQIYKACVMYANENRGVLPMPGGRESELTPTGLATCGVRLEEWGRLNYREGTLWPYVAAGIEARQQLFLCPSDVEPRFARQYVLPVANAQWPRNFSYNFTGFMAGGAVSAYVPNQGETPGPPIVVLLTRRHSGKANAGFADGHVEPLDPNAFAGITPDIFTVESWQVYVNVFCDR